MPASILVHPRRRISRACSSTVRRACARFASCRSHERPAIQPLTDIQENNMDQAVEKNHRDAQHGIALLNDSVGNKGTAFTVQERHELGLEGLLPPSVDSLDRQLERVMRHLDAK